MEFFNKVKARFTSRSQGTQPQENLSLQQLRKMREDTRDRVTFLEAQINRAKAEKAEIEDLSKMLPPLLQQQAQLETLALEAAEFVNILAEDTLKEMQNLKSQAPPPDPYAAKQAARAYAAQYKAQQTGGQP